jgi:carbohydrate-selective porin OprB
MPPGFSAETGPYTPWVVFHEGVSTDRAETNLELTYRLEIYPWLAAQHDIQYVVKPSTNQGIKNALTIGLRIPVELAG